MRSGKVPTALTPSQRETRPGGGKRSFPLRIDPGPPYCLTVFCAHSTFLAFSRLSRSPARLLLQTGLGQYICVKNKEQLYLRDGNTLSD